MRLAFNFGQRATFVASVLAVAMGCTHTTQHCDLAKPSVSARVIQTSITAPPGGPARHYLEVKATGFHPNARAIVEIPFYPALSGTESIVDSTVTMDAQGNLVWDKDPATFLLPGADPALLIYISVRELTTGCVASVNIKQGEFIRVP